MDSKELVKSIILALQGLQALPAKHTFRMHFINLYFSALGNIRGFFSNFLNSLKANSQNSIDIQKLLQKLLEILNAQLVLLQKLETQGYFNSFGLNFQSKDSLAFLYKSTNELIETIEKAQVFDYPQRSVSLLRLPEKDLEGSLIFLDDEVQKCRNLREKNQLDFNMSLRQIQNDLAYVFFVKQLETSVNFRKRLIKRLDFITGFQKFMRDFEPSSEISSEQLWIIEKKLGMKENLTASKIDEFFSEIMGNVNERVRISGLKKSGVEDYNRGMTAEFLGRKMGGLDGTTEKMVESKCEIDDFILEEEKHDDIPKTSFKKELTIPNSSDKKTCAIY